MKLGRIFTFALATATAMGCGVAMAQTTRPDNNGGRTFDLPEPRPGETASDVRQEVKQFVADLDNPNYDYGKIPDEMRQMWSDVRSVSQSLDQDQARELRMELFQQVFPAIQRNLTRFQHAIEMESVKGLQAPLGASDDEFAVIQPLLFNVVEAMRDANGGNFRFRQFGPRQNNNAQNSQNSQQQLSPVDQASEALQTAIDDPNSDPDLIKTRVDTLRQAKDKATQDLTVARNALRAVLTVRQEAVLVDDGILD
jgi:hypothetical protein